MVTVNTKAPVKAPAKTVKPAPSKSIPTAAPAKPSIKKVVKALSKVKLPATKKVAKSKPVPSPKTVKPAKPKKPKMVRDSFTIPKAEYAVLEDLKLRAIKLMRPIKKGELLRAGIKALAAMPDTAFLAALNAVPTLKTGRPVSKSV